MQRLRGDFLAGSIDALLGSTDTTISGPGIYLLPVITDTVNYMALSIGPDGEDGDGNTVDPEIIYVTAHAAGANTATIARGQENTSAQEWVEGTYWQHSPTAFDFDASETLTAINTDEGTTIHRLFVGATDPDTLGYVVDDGDVWIRTE